MAKLTQQQRDFAMAFAKTLSLEAAVQVTGGDESWIGRKSVQKEVFRLHGVLEPRPKPKVRRVRIDIATTPLRYEVTKSRSTR
jgi:hypothetical protein